MTRNRIAAIVIPSALVALTLVGAVAWRYHEQPQFCATCHIMEPYLQSWNGSDFLAADHAEQGVACLDCHEPTLQQQVDELVTYVQGDFEVPLDERKYPLTECFKCHEHGSYEQLVQLTADVQPQAGANPHNSHYAQMECRLCHKMHRQSEDYCAQCHTWGWEVP